MPFKVTDLATATPSEIAPRLISFFRWITAGRAAATPRPLNAHTSTRGTGKTSEGGRVVSIAIGCSDGTSSGQRLPWLHPQRRNPDRNAPTAGVSESGPAPYAGRQPDRYPLPVADNYFCDVYVQLSAGFSWHTFLRQLIYPSFNKDNHVMVLNILYTFIKVITDDLIYTDFIKLKLKKW